MTLRYTALWLDVIIRTSYTLSLSGTTQAAAVYSTESKTGRVPALKEILGADAVEASYPVYHVKHHSEHHHHIRGLKALDSTKTIVGNVIQPSVAGQAGYYVKMQLGTPVQDVLLHIDTGSNLFWTQCATCNPCVPTPPDGNYDPRISTTFKTSNVTDGTSYGDGTVTSGNISADTLTIASGYGNRVVFPNFLFLCGTNNSSPVSNVGSGIVGMDLASTFLAQLHNRGYCSSRVFRYCFPNADKNPDATSFLSIGPIEKQYLPETITEMLYTLLRSDLSQILGESYVSLNLTGISVAGQRLDIDISALNSPAFVNFVENPSYNITILDSGTTLTYLPASVLSVFQQAFGNATDASLNRDWIDLDPKDDCVPNLCFNATVDQAFGATFPTVSYIFPRYGSRKIEEIEVVIPGDEMMDWVDNQTFCLRICGVKDNASTQNVYIIGVRDQRNFLIEYDYEKLTVGFQRASCAFEG
ncbi:hypothetical protein R1sor_019528 [Riccia sorocarpa]|uniref:Peptidase A1 domain-containing protein n=1 Tax=Riccia sorocarpa TaxID=122646 RepID=A0ABD3IDV1_9MARC